MSLLKVFICYAREDMKAAERLYESLKLSPNVSPWLDVYDLLPGVNWEEEISSAIESSRFVILVLSTNSVNKYGYFQAEIREVLKRYSLFPPGEIFLLPVRINKCTPKQKELKKLQWVDLFSNWAEGIEKIEKVILLERDKILEDNSNISLHEVASKGRNEKSDNLKQTCKIHLDRLLKLKVFGLDCEKNISLTDFGKELFNELIESDKVENSIIQLLLNQIRHRRVATSEDGVNFDEGETYSDYEFGAKKREKAAIELGKLGRPEAIEPLVTALCDSGDWGGGNEHRTVFYKRDDGSRVRRAAVEALALIGKNGYIQAIDELKKASIENYYFDVRIGARENLLRHFNFDPIKNTSLWHLKNEIKKIVYDAPPLRSDDWVLPFLRKKRNSNDPEITEYCDQKINEIEKKNNR